VLVLKRPSMLFSQNDPAKSTEGVLKNEPVVLFGNRFRVRPERTPGTPGPVSQNWAKVVLGIIWPKWAGVGPDVFLWNALRTGSVVVSDNETPSFSGSLRPLLESAGSRRLPRVLLAAVINQWRKNIAVR
jgi:hypothetical protein